MTIGFHDVQLPVYIEQNAVGGPLFSTSVTTVASGAEVRNQNWMYSKQTYDITYGVTELMAADSETYDLIDAFFRARRGQLYGFRFKDWLDYSVTGQDLGPSTGQTAWQLLKVYPDTVLPYTRLITRPVVGTINIYNGGTLLAPTAWTLGNLGVINLAQPIPNGSHLSADFQFDVPVRFADDQLDLTAVREGAASVNAIKLQEIIETQ